MSNKVRHDSWGSLADYREFISGIYEMKYDNLKSDKIASTIIHSDQDRDLNTEHNNIREGKMKEWKNINLSKENHET